MKQSKKNTYRWLKSLLMLVLAVNFIYAGSISFSQMDIENCCHSIKQQKSCCSIESESASIPSCHSEKEIIPERMDNCGCIHNSPIAGTNILLKNKIELPKTFATKIVFETENNNGLDSSLSNSESIILVNNNPPIFIINSTFLI